MKLNFTKMNSQGNDFIIVDNTIAKYKLTTSQVKKISSRDNIGCDQLLLLNIKSPDNVQCQIFNQDGTEAYQCGNGMRAIMSFLHKYYNYEQSSIAVKGVKYDALYLGEDNIKINMGQPVFLQNKNMHESKHLSLSSEKFYFHSNLNDEMNTSFSFSPIMLGNFHCVVFTKDCYDHRHSIIDALYDLYNPVPNISFILNLDRFIKKKDNYIELKVYERGAGWTSSCGSGASATAAFIFNYSRILDTIINRVSVEQDGGILEINYDDDTLYLSGPTSFDYEGIWND